MRLGWLGGLDQRLQRPGTQKVAVALLLAIFFTINLTSVWRQSLTYDEPEHYRYGAQILDGNPERFDDSKMPFSAFNALPARLAAALPAGGLRLALESMTFARMVTVVFSMGSALLVYAWSKRLCGHIAGLLSLLLYTWEPYIIAHSQLITTDVYALGTVCLTVYALWRFNQERNWKRATFFAITLGVSQLAKYTAIFLYPLCAALLLVHDIPQVAKMVISRQFASLGKYAGRMLSWGVYALAISILIINAGFLFHRSLRQFGEIHFKSDLLLGLQTRLVALEDVPVPLPHPYLRGLDLVRYRERRGVGWAKVYLLGRLSKEGIKGYYLVATLFKAPLSEQVLFLLAIVATLRRRQYKQFLQNELFLWGPVLFFAIYFNFFYWAQIGIRFYLVVFPFVHILTGSLVKDWQIVPRRERLAIGGLVVYMLVSVLSYFPHYIPYFNELILDRRLAYRVLADSNLDWGQSGWYIREYLQQHPDVQLAPAEPVAGTIAVNANHLVGITAEPETYRWLRENFRPVGNVAYAYLIYQIEEKDLIRLGIDDP